MVIFHGFLLDYQRVNHHVQGLRLPQQPGRAATSAGGLVVRRDRGGGTGLGSLGRYLEPVV